MEDSNNSKRDAAFMGKVTAGLSHEFKNTLAIISESVGLMADLLDQAPPEDWPVHGRLKKIIASIDEQMQRGDVLVKRLNSFAHSIDKPVAGVEFNALLGELTAIAERFARVRRVELETNPSESPVDILTDPFRIRYVLFSFIEWATERSPRGANVRIDTRWAESMAQVHISSQGEQTAEELSRRISTIQSTNRADEHEDDPELDRLLQTVVKLGGTVAVTDAHGSGVTVILSFPKSLPGS
jgi:signal transduction histidine kinase